MLEYFLNPFMLMGLAGLSLPILVHLLSRKKYDVVAWGAMQFLELRRKTRRRIRLQYLLLLLLRMALVALIVLAMARPWFLSGGWFGFASNQGRDVVIVIDGSASMGWEGETVTPHATAVGAAERILDVLRPGDTVGLVDARERVRAVIDSPTHDFDHVRDQLEQLPVPSGSSNLADAMTRAVGILNRGSNLVREVIVLGDAQSLPWRADDTNEWARFDAAVENASVKPRVRVMDVFESSDDRVNFSVDRLSISRESVVANIPLRISTKVRYYGGRAAASRRVDLEVDGQRLDAQTLQVQLEPGGEANVEFHYRFASSGSHRVAVVIDGDNLSGDNRSEAVVLVDEALPALLVDGTPHLDRTRGATFFASAALTSASNETPWVRASVISAAELEPDSLTGVSVVVLANVRSLSDAQVRAIEGFVSDGGGLFVALGDQADASSYNASLFRLGQGLLPAELDAIQHGADDALGGRSISSGSLELTWLTRFRSENGGGFTEARFKSWWKLQPVSSSAKGDNEPTAPSAEDAENALPASTENKPAVIAARLETGDPLLITRHFGAGRVALMAAPLDADWSSLPAKPDFVPFLHELLFHLSVGKATRNVDVGDPLSLVVPDDLSPEDYEFVAPDESRHVPTLTGDERRTLLELPSADLPGIYLLQPTADGVSADAERPVEYFAVNFDRSESDLTPLDHSERQALSANDRLRFVESEAELKQAMFLDESRSEIWRALMLVFLLILVAEALMTRRLVAGGHEVVVEDVDVETEARP